MKVCPGIRIRESMDIAAIKPMMQAKTKSIVYGSLASAVLLGIYFTIITLISGWNFALGQFSQFWYFIIPLTSGFGIQVGLYTYLKAIHCKMHSGKVVAVSGGTSTAAMVSCCTHYLVNILPVLGATGIVSFAMKYQVEIFWVGLAFNLAGIIFIGRKIIKIQFV